MSEQKTRFYLIRHGETLWNRQGRYQGSTDIELSEEGLAQAELVAKTFSLSALGKDLCFSAEACIGDSPDHRQRNRHHSHCG